MNAKVTVSIVIIVLIVFFGFLIARGGDGPNPTEEDGALSSEKTNGSEKAGGKPVLPNFDKAPSFSLEDIEGKIVNLDDFKGRTVIVNSWATWCPFCVDELPDFAELQKEFGDKIVMIAINRQESLQKSKSFTDNLGITENMLYLLDPKDDFYKSIGGFSMPETLFIDGEQNIRIHKRGPMELSEMISRVNSILN
ncbi:hypothetical protein COV42_00470 [Candidatus Campbellbacteria bacterium CG11_big_fil_rev_8_21_14_0_20_44_21]|uniref:Thioredoxin domain-containing protein n=1 Tax=Candidatus Campbellbacteria bacterium CG22_combo_CG10-13_8_21_14_all_43_18 TaxID=1974530 RepID=A0A2H0DY76_9BACT|nr:MAG: hypothetical protein COW82_00820 [Candidatus Campbellbacteria bacterium CG22_combo_CG10-13_8_21_14_all_43_18]PIR24477.1 MAG: hypothetical protein COV42_00470 [Candidatus Campbellbacteria bacterium CG11_big_fil_rev_8_21_14_0_20_44_21]